MTGREFDWQHMDVVFGDKRTETHVLCDGRTLRIEPDMMIDFTNLPFDDNWHSIRHIFARREQKVGWPRSTGSCRRAGAKI
jgi:hypothetical protein